MLTAKNNIANFFIIVIMAVLLLVLSMKDKLITSHNDVRVDEPLTTEQQIFIVREIGMKGLKESLKNNCYNAIKEKIQTGKWSDDWCYQHYRHTKF